MEHPLYKKYGKDLESKGITMGHYNGYVGFSGKLPNSWQGSKSQDNMLDDMVEVHGGITFDSSFSEKACIIPLTEIPVDFLKYRIIGFDCAHLGDTAEEWTFERTKEETLNLYKKINKLLTD